MALLWCDGFDSYGTSGNNTGLARKYVVDNDAVCDVTSGRDAGNYCLNIQTSGVLFTPHLTTNATLIAGCAFKLQNLDVASRTVLSFRIPSLDGSTVGYHSMDVVTTSNTSLYVNFNASDIGSNSCNLAANTWYYLEFKVVTHASAGTISVKLDGVEIIANSSINTRFSATYPFYSSVGFRGVASQELYIDDFYVCDGTGSINNDFLGACIVRDIYPTSDVASGNWTANGGGAAYVEVDETVQDTTTFISTGTTGNQQLFETANLSVGGAVMKGLMVSTAAKLTGNAAFGIKTLTQQGSGTINVGTEYPVPSDAFNSITHIQEVDPDGATWNESLLNTFRMGVRAD